MKCMETLLHPTAYGWSKGEFLAETLLGPAGYLRNCDREHQTGTELKGVEIHQNPRVKQSAEMSTSVLDCWGSETPNSWTKMATQYVVHASWWPWLLQLFHKDFCCLDIKVPQSMVSSIHWTPTIWWLRIAHGDLPFYPDKSWQIPIEFRFLANWFVSENFPHSNGFNLI